MEEFRKVNLEKLDEINRTLLLFNSNYNYPGKNILEDSKDLLMEVNILKSESKFFKFICNRKDEFLDVADDLSPVLSFFNGAQKGIFEDASDAYKDYEDNMNLISDTRLNEIADEINRILIMPSPYSFIKDLPNLTKEFNERLDGILNEERKIIEEDINSDEEFVLSNLDIPELKLEFKDKIPNRFNRLRNKLSKQRNISIIKGISSESENLRVHCLDEIIQFRAGIGGGSDPQPIIKNISLKQLISKSNQSFQNEDDINEFLKLVEKRIKEQLKDNDVVNVSFRN